jgi:hypothetical protein
VVTKLPVYEVPQRWENLYTPSEQYPSFKLRAGQQDLSELNFYRVDQYVRIDLETGALTAAGEAFVYELFRLELSGFDEMAWRSCNRNAYGLEGDGNDSLGYDFSYQDIENRLAGRSDRPLCCIEVKSSSGDGSEPFQITDNEWERARECHQTAGSVYIIVPVAHVRDDPRIADVIIDPFGLYRAGQVGVVMQDMWVYVGLSQSPNREAEC